ncbi:hypothetical protein [Pricia sp.]|uniref:hypothetical protein n=1 Tax=Pricia sp. TaxID=2268138 RepID=UPI003593B192
MKPEQIFIFVMLLCDTSIHAQTFYKIENDVVDESTLNEGLDLMAQEYSQQIVTYKTFERVQAQDSVIENISIVVLDEEDDDRVYRVFDFLGKPLPGFSFEDDRGMAVTNTDFLGKYTVLGLYKEPGQLRNSYIKAMNDLIETGRYNAVALIAKNGAKKITRKADFPILNECIGWYIENLSIPESPKFLVLDEKGKLRFIFQDFPDKRSTNQPIDSRIMAIFDILK